MSASLRPSPFQSAREIREWQPAYVLNLLRTPAYAAAARATSGSVDGPAELRAAGERRDWLADASRSASFVMSEAALHWRLGSAGVMFDQVRHLREIARLPHLDMGIIPLDTPADFVIGHAFHVYDCTTVVVGTFHTSMTLTDPDVVGSYLALFERLEGLAHRGDALDDLLARSEQKLSA